MIREFKNTVPWTYVISDLKGQKIVGAFYKKELQKVKSKRVTVEKVIKRRSDRLYIKWKGYNSCFNSWID